MKNPMCMVGLLFALLLTLLAPQNAMAAGERRDCSSSIPGTGGWNEWIRFDAATTEVDSPILDAQQNFQVTIECADGWDDGLMDGANRCDDGNNWTLEVIHAPPSGVVGGKFSHYQLPDGVAVQVMDGNGSALQQLGSGRFDTGVPIQGGANIVSLQFQLYRTGLGMTRSNQRYLDFRLLCSGTQWSNQWGAGGSKVTLKLESLGSTCSMTNVFVNLPTVSVSSFEAIGDTAGEATSQLNFKCLAGVGDTQINFSDGGTDRSNGSNALGVATGAGKATGVGVQMHVDGNVVMLSPHETFDSGGTAIDMPSLDGSLSAQIPFTANYVQVGPVVTPGEVEAKALVNILYY